MTSVVYSIGAAVSLLFEATHMDHGEIIYKYFKSVIRWIKDNLIFDI